MLNNLKCRFFHCRVLKGAGSQSILSVYQQSPVGSINKAFFWVAAEPVKATQLLVFTLGVLMHVFRVTKVPWYTYACAVYILVITLTKRCESRMKIAMQNRASVPSVLQNSKSQFCLQNNTSRVTVGPNPHRTQDATRNASKWDLLM